MDTTIAYKLFSCRDDGTLGPLFINSSLVVPVGTWLPAECHPTKGFAVREGWHAALSPYAPHLKVNPKGKLPRVWTQVELKGPQYYDRPESQGGTWVLGTALKVLCVLTETQVNDVLEARENKYAL